MLEAQPPPPDHGVLASVAARELGVSIATLSHWRARGCPAHPGQTRTGQPAFYYVLDDVRAWRDKAIGQGHGGTRPGAGRPKKTVPRGTEPAPLEEAAAVATAERLDAERKRLLDPLHLLSQADDDEVSRVSTQKRKDLVQTAVSALELSKLRGELLEAEDVKETWAAHAQRLKDAVTAAGPALAGEILSLLALSPEHGPAVRSLVEKHLREMLRRIVDDESQNAESAEKR